MVRRMQVVRHEQGLGILVRLRMERGTQRRWIHGIVLMRRLDIMPIHLAVPLCLLLRLNVLTDMVLGRGRGIIGSMSHWRTDFVAQIVTVIIVGLWDLIDFPTRLLFLLLLLPRGFIRCTLHGYSSWLTGSAWHRCRATTANGSSSGRC